MPGTRTTILAGALLFTGCDRAAAPTSATAPNPQQVAPTIGPRFTLLDPEINFGVVDDFETRTAEIRFTNSGDAPLEIKHVQPTCGCTTARLDTRTFAPGKGDAITMDFEPKGSGDQVKYLKIHTNDPSSPVTNLPIKSNVRTTAQAAPRTFQLGEIPHKEPFNATSILTAKNPGFVPTSVSITGKIKPWATGTLTEITKEGDQQRSWQIDLQVNENLPWGWHTGTAVVRGTVKTPDRIYPHNYSMAVTCSAQGVIRADDTMFRFLVVNPGRKISKTITLTRADGKPFKVTKTSRLGSQSSNTLKSTATAVNQDETAWAITLSGTAPNQTGELNGTVFVYTDVEEEAVLPIRYTANVQQPR